MNIWVSMISLNEGKYIDQALASCTFADGITVVDGDSRDRTKTVIEDCITAQLEIKKWANHFGDQRQYSLDLIPQDVDWWMRLDADETYSKLFQSNIRQFLKSLPESVICVRIRQTNLYQDTTHYSANRGGWETWPRIFRNLRLPDGRPAWQWMGQVHEYPQLMTRDGLKEVMEGDQIINWNVPVIHHGWLDKKRRKKREDLYTTMTGSNFKPGAITSRVHVVKEAINV